MNQLHGILFADRTEPDMRVLTGSGYTASLPYGGNFRIIDFMLSNFVNAGICDVGMIVQGGCQELLNHVGSGKAWNLSRKNGGLEILPPISCRPYLGWMDALWDFLPYLRHIRQEYVLLATGDYVTNFPIDDMLVSHKAAGADITVAYRAADDGTEKFLEICLLSTDLLIRLTERCAERRQPSFHQGILVEEADRLKIHSYFFTGFAGIVRNVQAYYDQNMALLASEVREELFHPNRPIQTVDSFMPGAYYGPEASVERSLVSDHCQIEGAVSDSVLLPGVIVEPGAFVSYCVLTKGSVVRRNAYLDHIIMTGNTVLRRTQESSRPNLKVPVNF